MYSNSLFLVSRRTIVTRGRLGWHEGAAVLILLLMSLIIAGDPASPDVPESKIALHGSLEHRPTSMLSTNI